MAGYGNTLKGKYSVKNPSKYKGNLRNVTYRSSWELKLMNYLDTSSNVLAWSSEETIIRYISPKDNLVHRYFLDFSASIRSNEGKIIHCLIEVKPYSQTLPPKEQAKKTKSYIESCITYAVNQAKWKAARSFCEQHNLQFIIMDEFSLGIKKR